MPRQKQIVDAKQRTLPFAKAVESAGTSANADLQFQEKWTIEFQWLRRDAKTGAMFCKDCRNTKASNVFGKEGSTNFQRSALVRHNESDQHRISVNTTKDRRQTKHDTSHGQTVGKERKSESTDVSAKRVLMETVQFMINEEIPDIKFPKLMEHMTKYMCPACSGAEGDASSQGGLLTGNRMYQNYRGFMEMETALAAAARDEVKELISESHFIGLMVDESVDIAISKNLIIYIRVLENGSPKIVFGDCVKVKDGKADTILNAIVQFMDRMGIEFGKVVGLGSDGAAVMLGRLTGVATRLKHINPNIISIHCAAHRLALAASYAAKACLPLVDLQRTITQIYTFFEYSAVRYEKIKDLVALMRTEVKKYKFKKFQKPSSVRWLSLQHAVQAVKDGWGPLVMCLENEFEVNKTPEAKGLAQKVGTYNFLTKVCLVLDVLEPIGKMSLVLQRDTVDVGVLNSMLQATLATVSLMKDGANGRNLQTLEDEVDNQLAAGTPVQIDGIDLNPTESQRRAAQSLKKKYTGEVIKQIDLRLPQTSASLLHDLNDVLNPERLPKAANLINKHGIEQLEHLCQVFGNAFSVTLPTEGPPDAAGNPPQPVVTNHDSVIDSQRAKDDFFNFKGFFNGNRQRNLLEMCTHLLGADMRPQYPDFSTLAEILLTIPITSVPCERGFSQQNRVKSKLRNRLSVERLAQKMMIKHVGTDLKRDITGRALQVHGAMRKRKSVDSGCDLHSKVSRLQGETD